MPTMPIFKLLELRPPVRMREISSCWLPLRTGRDVDKNRRRGDDAMVAGCTVSANFSFCWVGDNLSLPPCEQNKDSQRDEAHQHNSQRNAPNERKQCNAHQLAIATLGIQQGNQLPVRVSTYHRVPISCLFNRIQQGTCQIPMSELPSKRSQFLASHRIRRIEDHVFDWRKVHQLRRLYDCKRNTQQMGDAEFLELCLCFGVICQATCQCVWFQDVTERE
ncbi:hypothetical protein BC830DRAFT_848414 [Chytriomyces sp. MP71]|nr:hypothetical protein BC830DRAFT_848414 [Chytriomyces sp. MP71]